MTQRLSTWTEGEDRFAISFEDHQDDEGMYLWSVSKWRPSKGNEKFDYPRVGDRFAVELFRSYIPLNQNLKDQYEIKSYAEDIAKTLEYKW